MKLCKRRIKTKTICNKTVQLNFNSNVSYIGMY